jgi:hypothetical protein
MQVGSAHRFEIGSIEQEMLFHCNISAWASSFCLRFSSALASAAFVLALQLLLSTDKFYV